MKTASRDEMAHIAMVMYTGEPCVECGHVYETVDDLIARDVVFAGYHGKGRLACKACWPTHQAKPCAVCDELGKGKR